MLKSFTENGVVLAYNLHASSYAFYIISRLLIKPNTMQVPYK